jgi:hypothetical protein
MQDAGVEDGGKVSNSKLFRKLIDSYLPVNFTVVVDDMKYFKQFLM